MQTGVLIYGPACSPAAVHMPACSLAAVSWLSSSALCPTHASTALSSAPQLFTNSAAALPAEVDEQGRLKEQPRARLGLKQAWQRRMEATAARRAAQRQQQQQ